MSIMGRVSACEPWAPVATGQSKSGWLPLYMGCKVSIYIDCSCPCCATIAAHRAPLAVWSKKKECMQERVLDVPRIVIAASVLIAAHVTCSCRKAIVPQPFGSFFSDPSDCCNEAQTCCRGHTGSAIRMPARDSGAKRVGLSGSHCPAAGGRQGCGHVPYPSCEVSGGSQDAASRKTSRA